MQPHSMCDTREFVKLFAGARIKVSRFPRNRITDVVSSMYGILGYAMNTEEMRRKEK